MQQKNGQRRHTVHRTPRSESAPVRTSVAPDWLNIGRVGRIEVSSQDESHAIESALSGTGDGWRASESGEQVIRVSFRPPRTVHRIRLVFREPSRHRTQEFVLSWSSHRGETHREIVRQRFNFSPRGATQEVEDYRVELHDATWLELRIVPDVSGGDTVASLAELKIA